MKVPFKWLQEYVDINLSPNDLANRLTLAGNEVEGIQVIGGNWDNIVIGQVISVNPHPNAERLTLPTIDLGTEKQTIVCGAPNLRPGDKIAFAYVGAQLIDGHTGQMFRLKMAKIRDVVSSGMVCSEKELGISEDHEGIIILDQDAPVGKPLVDYIGDAVLDIAITPNIARNANILGIAREISALTGVQLKSPDYEVPWDGASIEGRVSLKIENPELNPRFVLGLIKKIANPRCPNADKHFDKG